MRHTLEKLLGERFRILAIETRASLNITQKEMGNRLQMSESSYSDIETGKSMCGTLTAILLLEMQEDPRIFLKQVTNDFTEWYQQALVPL